MSLICDRVQIINVITAALVRFVANDRGSDLVDLNCAAQSVQVFGKLVN